MKRKAIKAADGGARQRAAGRRDLRGGKARGDSPLLDIPGVGPATVGDLERLGIRRLEKLRGADADALYMRLCRIDGERHDPCLRDVFAMLVAIADGGPARPWWHYTPARKARDAAAVSGRKTRSGARPLTQASKAR